MDILTWVIIGGIAGWLSSNLVRTHGQDILTDLSLGILGALIGGIILSIFGSSRFAGLSLYSVFLAMLGAIVFIFLGRTLHQS